MRVPPRHRIVHQLCLPGLWIALGLAPSLGFSAPLDTPILAISYEGQASVAFEVTAGGSGAPTGFQIQWMSRLDYEALGGWPLDPGHPAVSVADFRGAPTLNTADGTTTFLLGPNQSAFVQIGDLFDETGVGAADRAELAGDTEYVFRAISKPTSTAEASAPSATHGTRTLPTGTANCTYTQGYWKNHASAWPVLSVTLGSVSYTQAQLLQIFGQPARGNGLVSLSHQLIAAKLNVAGGAVLPPAVLAAIQAADVLIANKVVPPVGAGSLSPGSSSSLTQSLDDFNNGVTGPGHCGVVPVAPSTWSQVKLFYR